MNQASSLRAVILDLDGTLMDTAGEIHVALARAFHQLGIAPLSPPQVEAFVGRGVRSLVERALAQQGEPASRIDAAIERFEHHYARVVGTEAMLFPGALEGLRLLRDEGLQLAVATNKPREFTRRLLEHAGIEGMLSTVVAGDDGLARKPAGEMLLAACERMASDPARTLMVGDSENDVRAARAAGCPVWCVRYGYNEGRPPETLDCDRLVDSLDEAARLIAVAGGPEVPPGKK